MSKQIIQSQNNWSAGISDDPRQETGAGFSMSRHFDIFTNPNKAIPYRSFEADTNDGSTSTGMKQYYVRDFVYASASTKLYGLGQTASGFTKIVYKADATTGNWTVPASSEGNAAVLNGCFVEYKDYLWGFQGTGSVFKWGLLSGTPAITNAAGSVGVVRATITAVTVSTAGSGYQINDILTVTTGSGTAKCIVTALTAGPGSGVSTVTLTEPGYNYTTGAKPTTVSPTGGTGAQITVSTVGDVTTPISSVANGIIGRDDNLYLPYNNILVRVYPSGTVQDNALKLPTNIKITSIANYGNFLAIGCAPKSSFNGVSKVFLWNLTSPDIQAVIDWGEGDLRVLETLEGSLVGITDRYLNNAAGAGRGSVIIQVYSGGTPQVVKELFTAKLAGKTIPLSKVVKNNRLFFAAKLFVDAAGVEYNEGIWSFGRKNVNYPFAVTLDYSVDAINYFGSAANFFFASTSTDGSITKTDDTATYTQTSAIETQIFNFEDVEHDKKINKVEISFRRLATGEQASVYYRVDDDTTWVLIGTASTVGSLSATFVAEASTTNLKSGREFKFKIESTGGAEITGIRAYATPLNIV